MSDVQIIVLQAKDLDAFREKLLDDIAEILVEERRATPAVLTTEQLCQKLSCSVPTITRLVKRGMPFFLVGSTRRFDLDKVLVWLRETGR